MVPPHPGASPTAPIVCLLSLISDSFWVLVSPHPGASLTAPMHSPFPFVTLPPLFARVCRTPISSSRCSPRRCAEASMGCRSAWRTRAGRSTIPRQVSACAVSTMALPPPSFTCRQIEIGTNFFGTNQVWHRHYPFCRTLYRNSYSIYPPDAFRSSRPHKTSITCPGSRSMACRVLSSGARHIAP